MNKVRVLTGSHAGVFIDWTRPLMKMGASEDDDIYIGDWNVQPIQLLQDADGLCEAQWPHADGDPLAEGESLDDGMRSRVLQAWVPVRFGAIILCIGPADEAWPNDADLLQRLFAPPVVAPVQEQTIVRRKRSPVIMACFTLIALASSAAVVGINRDAGLSQPAATPAVLAESVAIAASAASAPAAVAAAPAVQVESEGSAALLRKALDDPRWRDLDVLDEQDTLVVRGVLASREDVAEVHRTLDGLRTSKPISRQLLDVVSVESLVRESIPGAGLSVRRLALRRFEVAGSAKNPAGTERAITRLSSDLEYLGVTVVSAVEPSSMASARVSGTFFDAAGASFARTRDGVKHIVAASLAASAVRTGKRADPQ